MCTGPLNRTQGGRDSEEDEQNIGCTRHHTEKKTQGHGTGGREAEHTRQMSRNIGCRRRHRGRKTLDR